MQNRLETGDCRREANMIQVALAGEAMVRMNEPDTRPTVYSLPF
jgi:hypothetical protein